jgi:hypothetical protein
MRTPINSLVKAKHNRAPPATTSRAKSDQSLAKLIPTSTGDAASIDAKRANGASSIASFSNFKTDRTGKALPDDYSSKSAEMQRLPERGLQPKSCRPS